MKFKVKGLVFVGFAAAILSANAALADPDSTVTSKSYVDAKIAGVVWSGDTAKAPSGAAVSDALAQKQDIQDTTDYKVGRSGSWAAMTSAVKEATNGYVDVTAGTNGEAVLNLDSTKMTTTFDTTNGLTSNSTNLVTEGVIKQAIANASQVTNFISQQVGTDQNKAPSENAVNNYVTLKGVQVAGQDLTIDANKKVNLGAAAGKGVDTDFTDATSTDVPTTAAVADYVGTQLTNNQANWAETTTTDPSYIQNKPTALSQFTDDIDARNAIDSITVGGAAVAPDSNKAVALGAAAGKGADTSISSSSTDNNVPTSKAVYDYVDGLPAADIPAMPTQATDPDGYCDATNPCALVTENGVPVWKRIAQVEGD